MRVPKQRHICTGSLCGLCQSQIRALHPVGMAVRIQKQHSLKRAKALDGRVRAKIAIAAHHINAQGAVRRFKALCLSNSVPQKNHRTHIFFCAVCLFQRVVVAVDIRYYQQLHSAPSFCAACAVSPRQAL